MVWRQTEERYRLKSDVGTAEAERVQVFTYMSMAQENNDGECGVVARMTPQIETANSARDELMANFQIRNDKWTGIIPQSRRWGNVRMELWRTFVSFLLRGRRNSR